MHTTPTSLESIASDLLFSVSGGCHKRCCPAPAPAMQQQIIQMPAPAPACAPQILPQAAPPAPSGPTGDVVSTSVSINGQPVG